MLALEEALYEKIYQIREGECRIVSDWVLMPVLLSFD